MTASTRFLHHCTLLRWITTAVSTGLLVLLLLPLGYAVLRLTLATDTPAPGGSELALQAVHRALGNLGRGQLFHATVAQALRHIGGGVLGGALLSVFAVTNLSRWIDHGRGSYAYFDLSGIVLAVVGAALILLATVIDRARQIEHELDGIV